MLFRVGFCKHNISVVETVHGQRFSLITKPGGQERETGEGRSWSRSQSMGLAGIATCFVKRSVRGVSDRVAFFEESIRRTVCSTLLLVPPHFYFSNSSLVSRRRLLTAEKRRLDGISFFPSFLLSFFPSFLFSLGGRRLGKGVLAWMLPSTLTLACRSINSRHSG